MYYKHFPTIEISFNLRRTSIIINLDGKVWYKIHVRIIILLP